MSSFTDSLNSEPLGPVDTEICRLIDALRGRLKALAASGEMHTLSLPGKTMKQIQVEALTKCLRRFHGNREQAAAELKVARSSVFLWIKEWKVVAPPDMFGRLLFSMQETSGLVNTGVPQGIKDEDKILILTGKNLEQLEVEALAKCLRRNRGNREQTAVELDVARSTVFCWIAKYRIAVPAGFDPSAPPPIAGPAEPGASGNGC